MKMKETISIITLFVLTLSFVPLALALSTTVTNGEIVNIGTNQFLTDFGMVLGTIEFKLGNFSWVPKEIWLLPQQIDPEDFSKNLTISDYLQIPENITFSTCRTAIYYNQSIGYGFKIYNTASTTQILSNGTFCGLAYSGTYFIYAKY
jgi:hypothetical protein